MIQGDSERMSLFQTVIVEIMKESVPGNFYQHAQICLEFVLSKFQGFLTWCLANVAMETSQICAFFSTCVMCVYSVLHLHRNLKIP